MIILNEMRPGPQNKAMMDAYMAISVETLIPEPDIRERFERRVKAPPDVVMKVAYDFDMQSIWLIRVIIDTRKFILGGTYEGRRAMGLVEETRKIGWGTLVEEPGRLLICGAVCQPWHGDVKFTPVPLEDLVGYSEPDQVKIVWSLEAEEISPNVTRFSHEVRAVSTDAAAKRKFMRYWGWARFGIIAIRLLLLPAIEREAERKWSANT